MNQVEFDYTKQLTQVVAFFKLLESEAKLDEKKLAKEINHLSRSGRVLARSQLIQAYRQLAGQHGLKPFSRQLVRKLQAKPVRTISGVTPVTILTKPFPCPGKCIFCPTDARMPKSYLPSEPGAQRALRNQFDPYLQTYNRLLALYQIGHDVGKVEIIVLGGTWSFYPNDYQLWFIKECFRAMNEFDGQETQSRVLKREEVASWNELEQAQLSNETALSRCVGLVIETRPDYLTVQEAVKLRRLGCTKVQIGVQSLCDRVLDMNKRGHSVAETAQAFRILRLVGFKIHAHWMANLYGSSVAQDKRDYLQLFTDPRFKPDELKIYPCSLIKSAQLMDYYLAGKWQPYTHLQLLSILKYVFLHTPAYCRLTRVIRDIPSPDIVVGNKKTNFRQIVDQALIQEGKKSVEIRAREIRGQAFDPQTVQLTELDYQTSVSNEYFLQYLTGDHDGANQPKLLAFLRLSLPTQEPVVDELKQTAMIREVHVYGPAAQIGQRDQEKAQHTGLGTKLIDRAKELAKASGYKKLAVISAVGTREYYRKKGFQDGALYQFLEL